MDETKDRRRIERLPCNAPAKIAFYVPIEYGTCCGPNCFSATVVDFNQNGFGILLEKELDENAVVNIFSNHACQRDGNSPVDKVYQSTIKWVKANRTAGPGAFRAGVRHIE